MGGYDLARLGAIALMVLNAMLGAVLVTQNTGLDQTVLVWLGIASMGITTLLGFLPRVRKF